jgi:hypothetical protein
MNVSNFEFKITEIYCQVDEFCNSFSDYLLSNCIGKKTKRVPAMSISEISTIIILYQLSGYKCFKFYYDQVVLKGKLNSFFPQALSYNRFVELIPRCFIYLTAYMQLNCVVSETGIYYMDSKKIAVCHNRRIQSHKVFKGYAARGHCSVGYFFGFKLFLIINHIGQIVKFKLMKGNSADNNGTLMLDLLKDLKGKVFADKGFINQKTWTELLESGLQVITKIRSNMKNKLMIPIDKLLLSKRGIIESTFNLLMTQCDLEHTRHRSPINAFCSTVAALIAYTKLDHLPTILYGFNSFLAGI